MSLRYFCPDKPERCELCAYSVKHSRRQCHRYPTRESRDKGYPTEAAVWPFVADYDWCGEWKAKP